MRLGALLVVLVGGCNSPHVNWMPGQERAEHLIWRELYAQDGPPPPVEWRLPECETSPGHPGIYSYNVRGQCIADGFYWLGGGVVVMLDEEQPDWVSLFHEWHHAKAWLELGGDADPTHTRLDWKLPLRANAVMHGEH